MKRKCQQQALTSHHRAIISFSMVELLAVIAITSVLITVTTLNLKGFSQSGNITAAGNQVVDIASQARQLAVTRNAKTALVIIKSSTADTSDPTQPKIGLRTFCLMQYYTPPGGLSASWQMATRWETLPASVQFDDNSANSSFMTPQTFTYPITTVTNRGRSHAASQIAYQIFEPEGGMEVGSGSAVNYSANQTLRLVSSAPNSSASATGNYYDIYFNVYTGGTKVVRPMAQ